jgi:hypothetical protein
MKGKRMRLIPHYSIEARRFDFLLTLEEARRGVVSVRHSMTNSRDKKASAIPPPGKARRGRFLQEVGRI